MFRGSVKGAGYPLHSSVSPSIPVPCVTVCHHISTGVYNDRRLRCCDQCSAFWIKKQCTRNTEILRNTQSFVCRTTGLKSVSLRNVLWSATSTDVFSITSAFKKCTGGDQFPSFTSMLFMQTARFKIHHNYTRSYGANVSSFQITHFPCNQLQELGFLAYSVFHMSETGRPSPHPTPRTSTYGFILQKYITTLFLFHRTPRL